MVREEKRKENRKPVGPRLCVYKETEGSGGKGNKEFVCAKEARAKLAHAPREATRRGLK